MDATPALILSFLNAGGEPLWKSIEQSESNSPRVNLIQAEAVPARAGSFVEAEVESKLLRDSYVFFEPDKSLEAHGLSAPDASLGWWCIFGDG